MSHSPPGFGDLELETMQLIWVGGPMTAETVRERLPRLPKESTVRTVLRRLEDKGYLSHTVDQRTFTFHATEARRNVAVKAVKRIADQLCNGSMEEVLIGMVDTLDEDQLQALAAWIERAKQEQGKDVIPG
jgi:BlaI family penicillinase repressor